MLNLQKKKTLTRAVLGFMKFKQNEIKQNEIDQGIRCEILSKH